jgi:hypothetical protein
MAKKLNQVLAVEKKIKNQVERDRTDLYKNIQKAELFKGHFHRYSPVDDEGEPQPDNAKPVQLKAEDALNQFRGFMTELYDVIATKDVTNTTTMATVKVGDATIIKDVPVSYLLYLEKELVHWETVIRHMPVLDPGQNWTYDKNKGVHVSEEYVTYRTKKVPRTHIKYDATPEHPAQTEMYTEDVQIGSWVKQDFSGALPADRKTQILQRIHELTKAVKFAREDANTTPAVEKSVGKKVFDFIFGPA